VDALRGSGLTVWWDREIPGGERWREEIVKQLDAASCVVVCWTEASVGPEGTYVREEAERGKARGILLPVLLDHVDPPFGFAEVQALDLINWKGTARDPRCRHVVATARAIAHGKPRPKPPTRKVKRWGAVGATAALVAAGVGFIQDISGLQLTLCRSNRLRPVCRVLGLGGLPSPAEERMWQDAQRRTDGEGYRQILREYPDGVFAKQAQARLAACRQEQVERWEKRSQSLPIVVLRDMRGAASQAAAREMATLRVEAESRRACGAFLGSDAYRLQDARVSGDGWRCENAPTGWHCGFDGEVICDLEERSTSTREVCS
jgi:hypothetical protein